MWTNSSGFWGLVWVFVDKLTCILIASWKACNEAECAAPESKTQAWAHWWLAGCPVCIRVCHGFCSPMILHLSISRMKNQHMETICWKNLWHGDRPFFFADACECSIWHKRATNQVVNLSESTSHQSPAPDDRNEKADYWPFNPTNHLPFFRRKQSWITNPFLEASFLGLVHRTWFRFWWALFLWFSGWGNIKNNQGLYPPKLDIESSTLVHHPLDWKIIFHPTAPFLGWKRCPFGVVCLKKPVWCKASKELASSTKRQCFHIPNLCRIFPNSMKPF